jgi:hypothetical protein
MIFYYLICDPRTLTVLCRSHAPAGLRQPGMTLEVSKAVWNKYRAGDPVDGADLRPADLDRWLKATKVAS